MDSAVHHRHVGAGVIWRDADVHGLPPGKTRIISPYDIDARHSEKRGRRWAGYKVHVSETCDNVTNPDPDPDPDPDAETADTPQPPNLITNVVTNVVTSHAAVADIAMTPR